MKKSCCVGVVAVWMAGVFALTGCETKSADEASLTISPDSVELRKGDRQEFRVSGGTGYRWSVSSSDFGVLSSKTGDRVVYLSTANVETTVVISVQGSLGSIVSEGDTNEATTVQLSGILEAMATVTHVAD